MATLTAKQKTELDQAAARVAAGKGSSADKKNIAYAQTTYKYAPPKTPPPVKKVAPPAAPVNYDNLPADFDRTGLSPDQLSIANTVFGTIKKNPTLDTSALSPAEIQGFVQDATNALDPYYKQQQAQLQQQYDQQRTDTKSQITRSLEDLGITDSKLKADIATNVTRLNEDKLVQQGKIQQGFVDDVRNRQDNLEQQGLTFSGEAIRQLGEKSAYQTGIQGEAQKTQQDSQQALDTAVNRQTADYQKQLAQGSSSLGSSNFQNLSPDQLKTLGSSTSDIDRAISRAYQDQQTNLGRLDTSQNQAMGQLAGERSTQLRTLTQDEINNSLNLGRTLPSNYQSLLKFPSIQ